jgi:hypothetical protein
MPHDTLIKELRRELATYLKYDETLLRMQYGNRVLRRADYQHVSIREAIVPLGADPLVVCKMVKGDVEDLCTFVTTGQKNVVGQSLFECDTCQFIDGRQICGVCAQVCHKGHVVRPVSSTSPTLTLGGFCHCGAGAGGPDAPCRALEDAPEETERYFAPRLATDPAGDYLYILCSEYGLMKLGTGHGRTVTGKLYAQNPQLSAHTGGYIVCTQDRILLRSPITGAHALMVVDPVTLQIITGEMIHLDTKHMSTLDGEPSNTPSTWTVEVSCKGEDDHDNNLVGATPVTPDDQVITVLFVVYSFAWCVHSSSILIVCFDSLVATIG